MSMIPAPTIQRSAPRNDGHGSLAFSQISEPGCYVCHWSGHLLRLPVGGLNPGRGPILALVGGGPLTVTKLSDNPYLARGRAQARAASMDLPVNF
jgi:hypothetical protein